jgi:hypothetical protein
MLVYVDDVDCPKLGSAMKVAVKALPDCSCLYTLNVRAQFGHCTLRLPFPQLSGDAHAEDVPSPAALLTKPQLPEAPQYLLPLQSDHDIDAEFLWTTDSMYIRSYQVIEYECHTTSWTFDLEIQMVPFPRHWTWLPYLGTHLVLHVSETTRSNAPFCIHLSRVQGLEIFSNHEM